MNHTVERVESAEARDGSDRVPAADVRKALPAILRSPPFHSSKQSQELLQYIVDQTLAGHFEMLKERIIGAHVFGRRADYATNDDPIVRARAAEVRKRLALYYQAAPEEPVRIGIPSGSFRAIFEWTGQNPVQMPSVLSHGAKFPQTPEDPIVSPIPHEVIGHDVRPSSGKFRRRNWLVAIAASVAILFGALIYNIPSPEARGFNQFWSPILDNPHTTLIYVGGNAVYQLSPSYLDSYYRQHPRSQTEEMGFESYIPLLPGAKIDAKDLYPAKDTFVTIGDVAAITRIESLLVRRNRQFNIRFGDDVAFGDLRESPTILVGAHNNPWTLAMTGDLRYAFDGRNGIMDRMNPQKRWSTTAAFTEDYAIVSRVLNSKTGTTMITVAGVGFAGTQAAAEFVTNPQSISAMVKSLPQGWDKKDLQIVLHTTVTNQLPSAPDVVATYCW
jgi:hypothetical protein